MSLLNSLYHAFQQVFPSFHITEPAGKWALFGLVWLLFLFLIKPKPRKRVVPSLMFLLQRKKKSKLAHLLQRFIKDPLKLLQFFIALLFVFSLFLPIYRYEHDTTTEHTTLLIDLSASVKPVFKDIKQTAKEQLRGRVTIIGITDKPLLLAQNVSIRTAKKIIDELKPTDSSSAIGAALQLAESISPSAGSIVVVSDFRDSTGISLRKQMRLLREKGKALALFPVGIEQSAVFFADLSYDDTLKVTVKNTGKAQELLLIDQVLNENETVVEEKQLSAFSLDQDEKKVLTLSLTKGMHYLLLKNHNNELLDRLPIVIPSKQTITLRILTNHYDGYLKNFLAATNYSVTITKPPIIPELDDVDLVILYQWDDSLLITPLLDALKAYLAQGGNLLIYADPSFEDSKLQQLLPFLLVKINDQSQTAKTTQYVPFLEEPLFFKVNRYFLLENLTNALPLIIAKDNTSLATLSVFDRGKVLWYGVFDDASSFPKTLAYPLFFDRAIKWLGKYEEFSSVNKPVGASLKGTTILFEGKPLETNEFFKEGFYTVDGFHIALYQVQEEEYSDPAFTKPEDDRQEKKEHFLEQRDFPLITILIPLLFFLLLLEVYYIKWRGDI